MKRILLVVLTWMLLVSTPVAFGLNVYGGDKNVQGDLDVTGDVTSETVRDRANIIPNSLFMDNGFDLISLRPHPKVVNPVLDKDDVTDETAVFTADPSLFYEDGTWYMFFEVNTAVRTKIAYATSPDALTWTYQQVVLDDVDLNFSYPHVFKYDGEYYLIPSSNNYVRIYKATTFPTVWTLQETLSVTYYNDPTLFQYKGTWWLFAFDTAVTGDAYAYYCTAESPIGCTWSEWNGGAEIVNNRLAAARMAGRPIVKDDYVIFFFQDGVENYGDMIRAYKVTDLTTTTYSDVELTTSPILEESALETWRTDGIHTVDIWPSENGSGCLAVVDGHILSGSNIWSIGMFECGTSGFSDDIAETFGYDNDVRNYFNSAGNRFEMDLRTSGVNAGLRIKTDGDTNTFYVDGTNGYVGIGEGTPASKLDIESTDVVGLNVQTNSTLTVPSSNSYGMKNTLTINSAVNDTYNYISQKNTIDIDEADSIIGDVTNVEGLIKFNALSGPTTYSNVYGFKEFLSRIGINGTQTLTNYYGFYSKSSASGSGAFDGTNWYHFYAQDFAAYGGTVTNTAGLWLEKQTYGANNYGIVLNGDGAGADLVLGSAQDIQIYGTSADNSLTTTAEIFRLAPIATAPATCSIGDFYVDTSGAACACTAADTWSNMTATGTCS